MASAAIESTPLTEHGFGACIKGVDFSKDIPPETVDLIADTFSKTRFVVLKDCNPDDRRLEQFSKRFGTTVYHPAQRKGKALYHGTIEQICLIPNSFISADGRNALVPHNDLFEFDDDEVPSAFFLWAKRLVLDGPATQFFDVYGLYDSLTKDERKSYTGMRLIDQRVWSFQGKRFAGAERPTGVMKMLDRPILLRDERGRAFVHPGTWSTSGFIEDLPQDTGRKIIESFHERLRTNHMFTYSFETGDVVLVSNNLLHGRDEYEASDEDPKRRLLHRITVRDPNMKGFWYPYEVGKEDERTSNALSV